MTVETVTTAPQEIDILQPLRTSQELQLYLRVPKSPTGITIAGELMRFNSDPLHTRVYDVAVPLISLAELWQAERIHKIGWISRNAAQKEIVVAYSNEVQAIKSIPYTFDNQFRTHYGNFFHEMEKNLFELWEWLSAGKFENEVFLDYCYFVFNYACNEIGWGAKRDLDPHVVRQRIGEGFVKDSRSRREVVSHALRLKALEKA